MYYFIQIPANCNDVVSNSIVFPWNEPELNARKRVNRGAWKGGKMINSTRPGEAPLGIKQRLFIRRNFKNVFSYLKTGKFKPKSSLSRGQK